MHIIVFYCVNEVFEEEMMKKPMDSMSPVTFEFIIVILSEKFEIIAPFCKVKLTFIEVFCIKIIWEEITE